MTLKITVKTLDSQNYEFEAENTWTVQQFKDHIQDTVSAPANEQRLIFCGRVLQDDKRLTEYDCNGKVIHLVRRPPPSLDNQSGISGAAADSNNNNSTGNLDGSAGATGGGENVQFLDDNNVLFSALTLGPEGANMNNIVRHILTLQSAIYAREFGSGIPVSTANTEQSLSMTEIDRRLHNAARLLRITVSTINECMARIAALPPSGPRSSNERSALDTPRTLITAASSHTDLQRDVEMSTNETNSQVSRSSTSNAPSAASTTATNAPLSTTVDDISVGSVDDDTQRRQERPNVPRQSLTTDDLPQSVTRTVPQLPPPTAPGSQFARRGLSGLMPRRRGRQESELERYMTIFNYSCDLQNQFQGLARRYRHLIDISRRGGLIVPRPSTSTSETSSSREAASSTNSQNQPQRLSGQNGPMSLTLMNETRILGLYIPRIMHHISHLQHALSDFQVDFNRGRLMLCVGTSTRAGQRDTARRSVPSSQNSQTQQPSTPSAGTNPPNNSSESAQSATSINLQRPSGNLEGSVTITATAIETTPIITSTSTSNLRPQANATIVVTSEPMQGGTIRIPVFASPLDHLLPMDISERQQPTSGQQQARAPPTQQPTTSNSTQTVNRPIGVISGRIPMPFDYYLPCYSPWGNYSVANRPAGRAGETPSARIQFRTSTQRPPQASPPVQPTSANINTSQAGNNEPSISVTVQGGGIPAAIPIPNLRVNDMVSHLAGTILSGLSMNQNPPQGANTGPANHDPLLNIIPELALNAASQILGGVFGASSNQGATTNVSSSNQQTGRSQQTSSGTVMMDIDIDDSSSSQSESRYQDARESNSPVPSASNRQCVINQQTAPIRQSSVPTQASNSSPQPGRSQNAANTDLKYDRRQLVEAMQNHPDWIPIIEADIGVMEQQQRVNSDNRPFFSDAYLSSIPRKRRRLLTASPDRVLILQPSPSQAISNLLRRAITSSSSSNTPPSSLSIDDLLTTISNDEDIQSAYEDYIKSAVEARLRSDYDYCPEKFTNSSKYFK